MVCGGGGGGGALASPVQEEPVIVNEMNFRVSAKPWFIYRSMHIVLLILTDEMPRFGFSTLIRVFRLQRV